MIHLALLLSFACQQEAPPAPAVEPAKSESVNPLGLIHGTASLRLRTRWNGGEQDNDLYEVLTAWAGDPEKDLFSFSASVRFAEDLDGNRDVAGYYPYSSLADSYQSSLAAHLYTAYLDVHPYDWGLRLRGGRQVLEEFAEAIPFDGGALRVEAASWLRLGAFGGVPVNLYESATQGDVTYGGWAEARPWTRTLARVEYLHLKDDNIFGLFKDDLLGVVLEQRAGPLFAHVRYTALEGESRDLSARVSGSFADIGLVTDALVTYVFQEIQVHSYPLDPYASFMMTLEPYFQWTLRASQSLGSIVSIDAILSQRILVEEGQESTYNHEFVHCTISPRVGGWPVEGLSFSASADYWRSTADDYWTAGADLSYKIHRDITLGAGTSYALYSIDAFTGEERERVRLFYGSLRWKLSGPTVLDVRFSYEIASSGDFRTLDVGVRHAF